jgi:hypothetical protein
MMFYKRIANKEVEYYRKSEADEMGLEYIPWRDAVTEGQWILTDDNYVLKTTKVKYIPEMHSGKLRHRRRVCTGLCDSYPHGKRPMEIEKHMDTCSYGMVAREWWKKYATDCPAINKLLVKAILLGEIPFTQNKNYTREEIKVFDRIAAKVSYNRNGNNVRQYYNVDEVRMQLQEEIKAMAIKKGCTLEEVFDLYAEAKGIAREKRDVKGLIMVGDRYAGIIGMTSKMVTTGQQQQQLPATDDVAFTKILNDNDNG